MGRIEGVFPGRKKPAFIGFTVAGDPDKETCIRAAMALIDGGTDILELGVPFSDPVADGPTIQKADERALAAGTTVDTVFEIVRELRKKTDVPIVFLAYYNMVYHRGIDRFYRKRTKRGWTASSSRTCPLRSPMTYTRLPSGTGSIRSSSSPRPHPMSGLKRSLPGHTGISILSQSSGLPVSGIRFHPVQSISCRRVRKHTEIPLALGFGISTPDHAKSLCRGRC